MSNYFNNMSFDMDKLADLLCSKIKEPLAERIAEKIQEVTADIKGTKAKSNLIQGKYVGVQDLAIYLDVTRQTINAWIKKYPPLFGQFSIKPNGRVLYDAVSIKRYIIDTKHSLAEKMTYYLFPENKFWHDDEIQNWQDHTAFKKRKGWKLTDDEVNFLEKLKKRELRMSPLNSLIQRIQAEKHQKH